MSSFLMACGGSSASNVSSRAGPDSADPVPSNLLEKARHAALTSKAPSDGWVPCARSMRRCRHSQPRCRTRRRRKSPCRWSRGDSAPPHPTMSALRLLCSHVRIPVARRVTMTGGWYKRQCGYIVLSVAGSVQPKSRDAGISNLITVGPQWLIRR